MKPKADNPTNMLQKVSMGFTRIPLPSSFGSNIPFTMDRMAVTRHSAAHPHKRQQIKQGDEQAEGKRSFHAEGGQYGENTACKQQKHNGVHSDGGKHPAQQHPLDEQKLFSQPRA